MTARVWCYTIAKDEAVLMPYFLRHYGPFCERIIVYNDQSTDETMDLVQAAGGEIRDYIKPERTEINEHFAQLAEVFLGEARGQADWIVYVSVDEILYHPNIGAYLAECQATGITLPRVQGYAMISAAPPTFDGQLYDVEVLGVEDSLYSKSAVFSTRLKSMRYSSGNHSCRPQGLLKYSPTTELKLLHYRYFGQEWFEKRCVALYNRARGLTESVYQPPPPGNKYSEAWWAEMGAQAQPVVSV